VQTTPLSASSPRGSSLRPRRNHAQTCRGVDGDGGLPGLQKGFYPVSSPARFELVAVQSMKGTAKHARRKRVALSMVIEGFPGADDVAIHVVSARFELVAARGR
jgi:hypothetical protein